MALDYIKDNERFEILGGYFSPVSDAYGKPGLALWSDRVKMCQLAVEGSDYLMIDSWEASQKDYVRTARVLDHFDKELNGSGGIILPDGTFQVLLAESFYSQAAKRKFASCCLLVET